MVRKRESIGRREYYIGLGTVGISMLAGCLSDRDDPSDDSEASSSGENSDDTGDDVNEAFELEDDDETMLTVHLENETGETVSEDVRVTIEADDRPIRYIIEDEIEEGVVEPEEIDSGSYAIMVEGDDIEAIEESVTLKEGEHEQLTVELQGAAGDAENGETMLTVRLENEDGEPVTEDVRVTVEADDRPVRYIIEHELEGGIAEPEEIEPGSYTVTIESEEFDAVEEDVTLEKGEHEVIQAELEGVTGDGERSEEGSDDDND